MGIESLVDLVPIEPKHMGWIESSMYDSLRDSPARPASVGTSVSAIARLARSPSSVALVAHASRHPDDFVGWVVGIDGGCAYVYVKKIARRKGLGRHLLSHVNADPPIPMAHWTKSTSLMAAAGFPIRFDLQLFEHVRMYARIGEK